MKTKKILSAALCALLLAGMLTGCGAASKGTAANGGSAYDSAASQEAAAAAPQALSSDVTLEESSAAPLPENRKWIVTIHLSAETEDLDAMTQSLQQAITDLGGYVEDQQIYNGSAYASRRYRSASLTIRIPAADADSFTQQVSGMANLVSQEKSLEDITLQYVDTESRLSALETEQARLLELLEQAETTADLLEIEQRLSEVRYQLESVASQLRLYDNQVDYATIYLSIEEVQEYTPVEEPTLWQRISGGFRSSVKGLADGAVDIVVWVIVSSPYLIVLGGMVALVVALIRRSAKRRRKNKDANETPEK